MKKVLLIFGLLIFLFGCINIIEQDLLEKGEVPNLQEQVSYENINLIGLTKGETINADIHISNDGKTAKIELKPEMDEIKGFLGMSLDVKSTRPLKLNSISSNGTHQDIDLNSIIINSFFEEKQSNKIILGETPTFESKKVKQTIIIENKERIEKDIILSLTFDINTNEIKVGDEKIPITTEKPVVFKTKNYNLDFNYNEYSSPSYSFSYFIDNELYNFDWEDMKDTEHAVIITTDNEIESHIRIQSQVHLKPLETVIFDPSYSQRDLDEIISLTNFYGVSDLIDIKIGDINGDGNKDYIVMSEDVIYIIKNEGQFTQGGNDINEKKYLTKFTLPSGTDYKFNSIDVKDINSDGKADILTTINPVGAYIITNIPSGLSSKIIDPYNPGTDYSFVSSLGTFYNFGNAHIYSNKACFGVGNYPQSGSIYTHNVFCYNYPFHSSSSFDDPNALKFNTDYDLWYRTQYAGGAGCVGVPYYFNGKLYVGAPCTNGVSIITPTSGTITFTEPTNSGPSGFGSEFTHFGNSLFILANNRVLKINSVGEQIEFTSVPGAVSIDADDEYIYVGAYKNGIGYVYILNPNNGEIILELTGDITGKIAAGSLGILTDEGFIIAEITEDDLGDCITPPLTGPWIINSNTLICSGTHTRDDTTGNGYIQVMNDDITITCEDNTIIQGNGMAMMIDNRIGVQVENCEFKNYDHGIDIKGGSGNKIINNIFNSIQNTGIILEEGKNNEIINNILKNGGIGIRIQNSNTNIISNNSIFGNTQIGIVMGDDELSPGGYGNMFSNNEIIENYVGVILGYCSNSNNFDSDIICENQYSNVTIEDPNCWGSSTNTNVQCDGAPAGFCDLTCGAVYDGCVNLSDPSTYTGRVEFDNINNRFNILESITLCTDTYETSSTLYIYSNNIVLDCNNSVLLNPLGTSTGTNIDGIYNNGYVNTVIKNCYIKYFDNGISAFVGIGGNLNNFQILNNKLEGNGIGIKTLITSNHLIKDNNIFDSEEYGMYIQNSGSGSGLSRITKNTISTSNLDGMYLIWPGNADIDVSNNSIHNNIGNGIRLYSASGFKIHKNIITNNDNGINLEFLISGVNAILDNIITDNTNYGIYTLNLVPIPIMNQIIRDNDLCSNNGPYDIYLQLNMIGGGIEDNYCGTERRSIAGTISDCTNPCSISGSCVNLNDPLTFNPDADRIQNIQIDSFGNYLVNQDITLCPGTYNIDRGIGLVINASNIKIDCSGAVLDGSPSSIIGIYNDLGIPFAQGGTGVTIENCVIQNFGVGIDFINGANNAIIKNNIINNSDTGIQLYNSQNSLIETNSIENSNMGLEIDSISGTQINENYICGNSIFDIASLDGTGTGIDNTCTNICTTSGGCTPWNDNSATGCTYDCPSISPNVCAYVDSLSTAPTHGETITYEGEDYIAIANCAGATWTGWINGIISAPTKYVITENLTSTETCLDIGANNIEIEGCGHEIEHGLSSSEPGEVGIKIENKNHVYINSLNIKEKRAMPFLSAGKSIYITGTSDNITITNTETDYDSLIDNSGATGNYFENVTFGNSIENKINFKENSDNLIINCTFNGYPTASDKTKLNIQNSNILNGILIQNEANINIQDSYLSLITIQSNANNNLTASNLNWDLESEKASGLITSSNTSFYVNIENINSEGNPFELILQNGLNKIENSNIQKIEAKGTSYSKIVDSITQDISIFQNSNLNFINGTLKQRVEFGAPGTTNAIMAGTLNIIATDDNISCIGSDSIITNITRIYPIYVKDAEGRPIPDTSVSWICPDEAEPETGISDEEGYLEITCKFKNLNSDRCNLNFDIRATEINIIEEAEELE